MLFCFKQRTAYEMRISDWSSDVCSSDLLLPPRGDLRGLGFDDGELGSRRRRRGFYASEGCGRAMRVGGRDVVAALWGPALGKQLCGPRQVALREINIGTCRQHCRIRLTDECELELLAPLQMFSGGIGLGARAFGRTGCGEGVCKSVWTLEV